MRQPTKGRVLQERVWRFIDVLLTQAENSSNFEIKWETDKDTGRPNFVVKTRRRFLESLAQLKKHELTEVIKSLEDLHIWDDRRLKRGKGSEIGSFALKLWSTDAQRNREPFERVWDGSRTAKSKALEATYKSKDHDEAAQAEIDWRTICRTKLEKQKQLTTNRLMWADEMLFDINQICVDLALVERKKPDNRRGDDDPKQSQSYKPDYEETEKLEYNDFLTQVLKSEPSKNVAIIGEPGAGKTTLLQRIAFWILENTNGLPIWIPLGILPTATPTLKDYLLHHWLEDAIVSVTPKIKTEFEELLTAGRVWLLLDGVDEMVANFGNSLSFINNWIPGWCQHLSVVLTCRLNVWEANPYALNNFKTYRTLEFSPEKVEEFIQACFQNRRGAPTCAHELGIQLQQALNQPGKERIKDLVKNPLRLTLLCSTWHLREGKLPDTKAELYQQFVEEVYRWKKDEFPTTPEQREQINAKLKELAREAIDKEENRFCLRHKFVEGILGDREGSVFQWALNIGWLNQVGVDGKNPNPNQPVYAFFHPTFQEYFAALAIEDWKYFLNHVPDNPAQGIYRIFDPQWKEVILLWLGREDVLPAHKQEFLMTLVNFDGKCCDLYRYRALFLATAGLTESREFLEFDDFCLEDNSEQGNEEEIDLNSSYSLTELIVVLTCGSFNEKQQKWQRSPIVIEQVAEAAILEMEHSLAVATLSNYYLNNLQISIGCNWRTQWRVTEILFKIAPKNPNSLRILEHLMLNCPKFEILILAYRMLAEIELDFINENNKLNKKLKKLSDQVKQLLVAKVINICNNFKDKGLDLNSTYPINTDQIMALAELISNCTDPVTCQIASKRLEQLNCREPKTYEALLQLCASDNESIRRGAASALGKIYTDCPEVVTDAVNTLINLIRTSANESIYQNAALSIRQILQNQQFDSTLSALKSCRQNSVAQEDAVRYEAFYSVLFYCAHNLPYPAFYQAWHQQEEVDNATTPNIQTLNQADLPQSLQTAIANDPQLSQTIHLICIDSSQFIEPDNPAEIYDQMLDQNCPDCDSVPETMSALKLYWKSLKRNSHKRPFLVFYASSTHPYNQEFLRALSKFGREICVITEQPIDHIPLKYFTPSRSIKDILEWIRTN